MIRNPFMDLAQNITISMNKSKKHQIEKQYNYTRVITFFNFLEE